LLAVTASLLFALTSSAQFYGDPPDEIHPWAVHDMNRPQPPVITPAAEPMAPPSDAVVLFDGSDLSKWKLTKPKPGKEWAIVDGCLECVPGSGYIQTVEEFGDCQLHIEWASPLEAKGDGQGRGNSGVFFMGRTEVQVLDCYQNETYPDGMAGSVYGVNPPLVNALRPRGEFNSYDIIFRRPIFKDGVEVDPGYFTVFCNGVLIQDHTKLEGGGGHRGRSKPKEFPEVGPLQLQDHGNPVRFRNIWYRPLPKRAVEGGVVGQLSKEQTTAKRAEIAKGLRDEAAKLEDAQNPVPQLEKAMESLIYAEDQWALDLVTKLSDQHVSALSSLSPDQQENRKGEIDGLEKKMSHMVKFGRLPEGFAAHGVLQSIIDERGWRKKK